MLPFFLSDAPLEADVDHEEDPLPIEKADLEVHVDVNKQLVTDGKNCQTPSFDQDSCEGLKSKPICDLLPQNFSVTCLTGYITVYKLAILRTFLW